MQTEFGRYRLIRHLATGGMGEVYLAEAVGAAGFAKRLVIKTLRADLAEDPALVQQFVSEGRLLEALDHPNIAQVLDLGQVGEVTFLALEYVEGFDLRAILRTLPAAPAGEANGPAGLRVPEVCVWYVLASIAHALDHAQSRVGADGKPLGIVHHDVTPSNVMVRLDGHVKLVDFGVARTAMMNRLSATALRGKLPYLSPEHARQQPLDGRADLFALGLVAAELLSGERMLAVSDPSGLESAWQGLPERIARLSDRGASSELVALLASMTALEPDQRPATAAEVAERAERGLHARRSGPPARVLAEALAPAFALLQARARSFDQTLAQLVGLAGSGEDATSTLSLPGLEAVKLQASLAQPPPPPPPSRVRKRWISAGVSVLVAAIALGFWLGQRREPTPPTASTVPTPTLSAPVAVANTPAVPAALASPAPRAVDAAALPAAATAAVAAGTPAAGSGEPKPKLADARPRPKDDDKPQATLKFRVHPFGCEVRVNQVPRKPVGQTNRYEVALPPGDHKVDVRDPATGAKKTIVVKGLKSGEARVLDGGVCLGAECPE